MFFVYSCSVGWTVVVAAAGVVGRVSCLSLLHVKALSIVSLVPFFG